MNVFTTVESHPRPSSSDVADDGELKFFFYLIKSEHKKVFSYFTCFVLKH